jgi:L-threonylcarbamoyladenylate synthase
VHISALSELDQWAVEIPDSAIRLGEAIWPGPLTLILKRAPHVLDSVTGGQSTIGIRIPAHPVALALLQQFGGGIAAPSANRYGQISPTRAEHVAEGLGDSVTLILDGGPCDVGIESSIVDFTGRQPRLLRPGMLSRPVIQDILGNSFDRDTVGGPRVSGSHSSHYAPQTEARWLTAGEIHDALAHAAPGKSTGIVALRVRPADVPSRHVWRDLSTDPGAYAQDLYATLRELDALGLERILLERPPETDEWEGVRDRLRRAAGAGQPDNDQGQPPSD